MKRVKIYGAGSIGNHLAQACRRIGWNVVMCDMDPQALKRTKEEIYPSRYGAWDERIELYTLKDVPKGGFDMIFIGTPPNVRMQLALEVLKEKPGLIQLEKPVCTPSLEGAQELYDQARKAGSIVCVGYDHAISKGVQWIEKIFRDKLFGAIETIDVEFREHWGGIFKAHPWLSGPKDTYLGYWEKGGGASSEHSHATNLWQHFSRLVDAGKIVEVNATMDMVSDGTVEYDRICALEFRTSKGLVGRVVQDVVTKPTRKWAKLQGASGYLEWHCNWDKGGDKIFYQQDTYPQGELYIPKKRPDDFYEEILHIDELLNNKKLDSPISLERGLDTALVIAAAHRSRMEKRTMKIDYSKGYTPSALVPQQ